MHRKSLCASRHEPHVVAVTEVQRLRRLAEAEVLQREYLEAVRGMLGDRHSGMLGALGNLALNLQEQGKLAEAEPLFREVVMARREVSGNNHLDTMIAVGNLGTVLLEQSKLQEAEPLLVEAVAWSRKENGRGGTHNGLLVELLRMQGRLAEAEQELGTLVWLPCARRMGRSNRPPSRPRRSPRGCGTRSPTARPRAPPSCAPWWSGWASSWARRTRTRSSGSGCSRGWGRADCRLEGAAVRGVDVG